MAQSGRQAAGVRPGCAQGWRAAVRHACAQGDPDGALRAQERMADDGYREGSRLDADVFGSLWTAAHVRSPLQG